MAHRYAWGEGLTWLRKLTSAERAADLGRRSNRSDWTGRLHVINDKLDEPLRWRKSRNVFVCSGADLFHRNVPFEFIAAMFGVMNEARQHTYQILTKRIDIAVEFFEWLGTEDRRPGWACYNEANAHGVPLGSAYTGPDWRDHVWIGVSAEDQPRWDERVPVLAHKIRAAVKFVSAEPLLGLIDMKATGRLHLQWLIAGAESGPRARPMDEDWVRSLRDQCSEAEVPFFYKQRLEGGRKVSRPELDGRVWAEMPEAPCAG